MCDVRGQPHLDAGLLPPEPREGGMRAGTRHSLRQAVHAAVRENCKAFLKLAIRLYLTENINKAKYFHISTCACCESSA